MSVRLLNGRAGAWMMIALVALVAALAAQATSYAQDYYEYPEDLFYELLDEEGLPLDEARAIVGEEFDEYRAAEIAAYLCAPNPDIACEGSDVWAVWEVFLYGLYDGLTVDEVLEVMIEEDETLAIAIAIYWCSPPAGEGCEAAEGIESEEEYAEPEYEYAGRESFFAEEDQMKERPASKDTGAQFFGGKKRCSRTRDRRC